MRGECTFAKPQSEAVDAFTTKVNAILNSLAAGRTVHDDTLLSKFLDLMFSKNNLQLEKETVKQLMSWGASSECEPQITAFCLRLCSWLLQCNPTDDVAKQMLKDIPGKLLWRQAVVRAGWVECLARLASDASMQHFLHENIMTLWKCLWDDSLFVGQAAEGAVCKLLITQAEGITAVGNFPTILSLIDDASSTVKGPDPSPILRVINRALKEDSVLSKTITEVITKLAIYTMGNWQSVNDKNAAIHFLCSYISNTSKNVETRISNICEFLESKGEMGFLIKLASLVFSNFPEVKWLDEVISLPLYIILKKQFPYYQSHLVQKITEHVRVMASPCWLLCRCTGSLGNSEENIILLLDLLQTCCEPANDKFQLPAGAQRTKLLSAILDSLSKILPHASSQNKGEAELLSLLKTENKIPSVISKVYCCLKLLVNTGCHSETFLQDLCLCLQRHLCDMQWENRDTALQFICSLCKNLTGQRHEAVEKLCCQHITTSIWHSLSDSEPYVRSSAITFFGELHKCERAWHAFIQNTPKEKVVEKLLEILREDPSEFPRRAVIQVFCKWYKEGWLQENWDAVTKALLQASQDADWEVKLGVLQLWQIILTKWHGEMQYTDRDVLDIKENHICDEHDEVEISKPDKSMNLEQSHSKSKSSLQLKHKLNHNLQECETGVPTKKSRKDACESSSMLGQIGNSVHSHSVTEKRNQFLDFILKWNFDEILMNGIEDNERSVKLRACEMGITLCNLLHWSTEKETLHEANSGSDICTSSGTSKLKKALCDRDLGELIKSCSCSADEHIRNPISILDDLITMLGCEHEHLGNNEEGVIIDCY